jgi:peroxiredoxin
VSLKLLRVEKMNRQRIKGAIGFRYAIAALLLIVTLTSLIIVGGCSKKEYSLTITVMGKGTTTPSEGTYTYKDGQSITVAAFPESGWKFDGWNGVADHTSPTTQVIMDSNKTVLAKFSDATPLAGNKVGNIAPDFTLTDIEGKTVTLSSLKGKPVLIIFWANDMPSWYEQMHYFQAMYDYYTPKGLVFLFIHTGETASSASDFMQTNAFSFKPVLVDTKEDVASNYGILYIPTTIIIDATGIIKLKKVGAFVDLRELQDEITFHLPEAN